MKVSALRRPTLLGSFAFGFLSFALPVYSKQLGANALEIGGLFSIFTLSTALVRPLVGWAMDRWGAKPFFVVALTGYALNMTIFAVSSALPLLYLARLVQGIASSFMWISAYTLATSLLLPVTNNASEQRIGLNIKERYRPMRGYKSKWSARQVPGPVQAGFNRAPRARGRAPHCGGALTAWLREADDPQALSALLAA
jgi:MFS family permease